MRMMCPHCQEHAYTRTSLQLTFPDEVVATFDILVKSMPVAGGVNALLKGTIDTKVTGAVVWS